MKRASPYCQWVNKGEYWECSSCASVVSMDSGTESPPTSACRAGARALGVEYRHIVQASSVKRPPTPELAGGVGSHLKSMLASFGITAEPGCRCNSRAATMNQWGPDVCEQRLDEIVGWLREEAASRGLPFVEIAARLLVKRAISVARKEKSSIDPP